MRIFITGGAGFIGRNICARLSGENDLTVMDFADPRIDGVNFVRGDVMNPGSLLNLSGYDAVVHLAAVVGVSRAEQDPRVTLDVNITGTRNMLEACRIGDVKRFIFPSSSEVYGEPAKVPISEEDFFNPVSAYGVSKIAGEEYVKSFSKMCGIGYNVFRLFSIYGPGQSTDFVVPRFVKLALEGKPLTVHGDGRQVRSFCNVADLARAVEIGLSKTKNDVFNIGNSKEPVTMEQLAQKVVEETESKSEIEFVREEDSGRGRKRDVYNRIPNTEKARTVLGFDAKVSLADGIARIAETMGGN